MNIDHKRICKAIILGRKLKYMKNKLIISALISITFITILFNNLTNKIESEIAIERSKYESFLNTSVLMVINSIQDDIFYIFNTFIDKKSDVSKYKHLDNTLLLEYFALDKYFLEKFPGVLSDGIIVDIEHRDSELSIYNFENITGNYNKYLELLKSSENREIIYIRDFVGAMSFSLSLDGDVEKALIYNLNIDNVITYYLPLLIEQVMMDNQEDNNFVKEFNVEIKSGQEISNVPNWEKSDIIIDLNRSFNLEEVDDYYRSRLKRNNSFSKYKNLIDNHTYILISHKSGNLNKLYKIRKNYYLIGLIFLYIILIFSISFLFYTGYRLFLNSKREKEFTSLISHELKTPLSIIHLGSDNLSNGVILTREDVIKYGLMLKKEAIRLENMINNILVISTTQNSNQYKSIQLISICNLLNEILENSNSLLNHFNVELVIDNSGVEYIFCNEMTFSAALFNVVKNSIRYGAALSENKKVKISVREHFKNKSKGVLFSIQDFGPGINKSDSANIFKPFYRSELSKKMNIEGSGLGLSYAKKIIIDHHGYIDLKKEKGKGSLFEIWIPYRGNYEKDTVNRG